MYLPTTKGHKVENAVREIIKNAVKFFEEQEYMDEPTTNDEAIEIVRDIVDAALAESRRW